MVAWLSEFIRTFIAVEIENRDVLRGLIQARDKLVEIGADVKPVEDENIHLTLRFIGEVPARVASALCSSMSSLKYQRFQMHVKGIGVFPSLSRPRVVWAGVAEGSEKIVELAGIVERIVRGLGIPPEREEFVPHITILRVKSGRNIDKLVKIISSMLDMDFGYSDVTRLHVKKSLLTPRGPIYSDLCVVEFH
jgi:2'-5' RNA ligase